jgi:hypothetical protein
LVSALKILVKVVLPDGNRLLVIIDLATGRQLGAIAMRTICDIMKGCGDAPNVPPVCLVVARGNGFIGEPASRTTAAFASPTRSPRAASSAPADAGRSLNFPLQSRGMRVSIRRLTHSHVPMALGGYATT